LKSDCICLPIIVSYLYQKFTGKINLAYIIVALGHGLKRTSARFDFVRTFIDSLFICLRLLYVDGIVLDLQTHNARTVNIAHPQCTDMFGWAAITLGMSPQPHSSRATVCTRAQQ